MASNELRWFDSGQPPTLQGAVVLSYLNAAFGVLALIAGGAGLLVLPLFVQGGAGLAVANDKRWGYWLAVTMALIYLVFTVLFFSWGDLLNLVFAVVLVALLLHRQSRGYVRVFFR